MTHPTLDIDLFTDEALAEPFEGYRQIREAGPAVFLERYGVWAIGRYEPLRAALADWETFSSAQGIGLSQASNRTTKGLIIATDPPEHDRLRGVLADKLSPRALRGMGGWIRDQAEAHVERVLAQGEFDAVTDLAAPFPVQIVLDLVGLRQEMRPKVLGWAEAAFNAGGPPVPRTFEAQPLLEEQFAMLAEIDSDVLAEGSFGRAIYDAAAEGKIDRDSCVPLMSAYVTAGLDTTINAVSAAIQLFAEHPEQWDAIRADQSLMGGAFNEIVRHQSPVSWFSRVTTRDAGVDGVVIPAGSRVMMMYASGNRDERKWDDPERFDVRRNPVDHLAFGYAVHGCAGQGLARLEAISLLQALSTRVARFEIGTPVPRLNNRIRGLASLPTVAVRS